MLIALVLVTPSQVSSAPSGENCTQNVEYLQAGVDAYKDAFGENPKDLSQLLEAKNGKGPFVKRIDFTCPTDGNPYTVVDGKVVQSNSK